MSCKIRTGYTVPVWLILFVFPFYAFSQNVVPAFTIPDTVCLNNPVTIANISTGASSFFWNFCVADVNATPTAINLANPGGALSLPVFSDIVEDQGQYYAFVVNHSPGSVVRLDFGNSLLNTPTAKPLGNISNVMNSVGSEGIQIIKTNGKWYGLVVGGAPASGPGSVPKLITIYFGASLTNPAPTAVDWGNVGNMLQSIDLHVFQENGIWYGLTANGGNSTITRINFTNSFDNPPTGVNLGNIGGLQYPTGLYALNDNGTWRVFVANGQGNSLTRLDFGSSLLNTPTGVNLGNPGNLIDTPRDITILKLCGQAVGFITNAANNIIRLNFGSLTGTPAATALGNIGNLNFPHSLSKLFRVGNDIYSLITNVSNNSITRLKFTGCTNASTPNSALQNPPAIVYSSPGVYNISLTVDDGLPTQNTLCKQVVVLAPPVHTPAKTVGLCRGTTVKIGSTVKPAAYTWNTGATSDSISVNTPGTYWVESARFGCQTRDTIIVAYLSGAGYECDSIRIAGAGKVCSNADTLTYTLYRSPGCTQQVVFQADNQFATVVEQTLTSVRLLFKKNGTTKLKASYTNNCRIVADSITVAINFSPAAVNLGPDISSCRDTLVTLHAGSGFSSYLWQNGHTDSVLTVKGPGVFSVTALNFCNASFRDTLKILSNFSGAAFSAQPVSVAACRGDSLQFNAAGGTSYAWLPTANFNQPGGAAPKALVKTAQAFTLHISDSLCRRDTTIVIPVALLPDAHISVAKSNDINCKSDSAVLTASGGTAYTWSPGLYITSNTGGKITVRPPQAVIYKVVGTNASGCSGQDSIRIDFSQQAEQKLYVPNAFTPNSNGTNDIFRPLLTGPSAKYHFTIYNRWGQLIFSTSNPQEGWNGIFHGQVQPNGVYIYLVTAEGACNGRFSKKGTFILAR